MCRRTDGLTQFEVYFEKHDYTYTNRTITQYDYITITDADNARKMAHYKHGSAINIIHVKPAE
jgi:hypothetical protein